MVDFANSSPEFPYPPETPVFSMQGDYSGDRGARSRPPSVHSFRNEDFYSRMDEFSDVDTAQNNNVLSPLVKSLQSRLERAEEQVRRARDREKGLRDRLENEDVAQLLSAQRAQAEALRRENDGLRDSLRSAEAERENRDASMRRMQNQVEDAKNEVGEANSAKEHAEARIKELKDKMEQMRRTYQEIESGEGSKTHQMEAEVESMHEKLVATLKRAEEAEALAEHRGRLVAELEETVKRVNKELETVSVDLDLAAENELNRHDQVERLHRDNELLRQETVELRRRLTDAINSDEAMRREREQEREQHSVEISQVRSAMVSGEVVDRLQEEADKDMQLMVARGVMLRKEIQEHEKESRNYQKKILELERQLVDAGEMWRSSITEGEHLKEKIKRLEEALKEVPVLRKALDEEKAKSAREAERAKGAESGADELGGRLQQVKGESQNTNKQLEELLRTHVPRSALGKAREHAEKEALSKAQEVAELKKDLAVAHSDVARVADHSVIHSEHRIAHLEDLWLGLKELDANLLEVQHGRDITERDVQFKMERQQDKNRELLRGIAKASFDFERDKQSTEGLLMEARLQIRLEQERSMVLEEELKSVARMVQHFEGQLLLAERKLGEAASRAIPPRHYLRSNALVQARQPTTRRSWGDGRRELSPTRSPTRSSPGRDRSPSGREPLRALFLEMERAEGLLGAAASDRALLGRPGDRQAELDRKRIESLEDQLLDMQTNSIPLAEYSVLEEQLASETAKVRRTAERDLTARFHQQDRIISTLRREKQELKASLLTAEAAAEERMIWFVKAKEIADMAQQALYRHENEISEQKNLLKSKLQAAQEESSVVMQQLTNRQREREESIEALQVLQKQVARAEAERRNTAEELAKANDDIAKLKEALTTATEAVRRAAEQRADLATHLRRDESKAAGELSREMERVERQRADLSAQLRESEGREARAAQLLQESREREQAALEAVQAYRDRAAAETIRAMDLKLAAAQQYAHEEPAFEELMRAKEVLSRQSEEVSRVLGQHAAVQSLAHRLTTEVQELAAQFGLMLEVLTAPQEQLLQERARGRDEIMRLEQHIAEHTRQMQLLTQDYEERLRQAESRARLQSPAAYTPSGPPSYSSGPQTYTPAYTSGPASYSNAGPGAYAGGGSGGGGGASRPWQLSHPSQASAVGGGHGVGQRENQQSQLQHQQPSLERRVSQDSDTDTDADLPPPPTRPSAQPSEPAPNMVARREGGQGGRSSGKASPAAASVAAAVQQRRKKWEEEDDDEEAYVRQHAARPSRRGESPAAGARVSMGGARRQSGAAREREREAERGMLNASDVENRLFSR